MKLHYYPETDSLYIKLRPGVSVGNQIAGEDVVIDLGADGEPVGYDIQHASQHAGAIAEALAYLKDGIFKSSRKRIDVAALRAVTDAMPMQPESAGEFTRRMRDEDRY